MAAILAQHITHPDDLQPHDFAGKRSSALDSMLWVYEHLTFKKLEPRDAPSAGAWGMWQWARKAPDKFYAEVIRLLARKADLDMSNEGSQDWTDKKVSEIDDYFAAIQALILKESNGLDQTHPEED